MHDVTRTATKTRHHALDGIRGLAALAVANYHFLYYGQDIHVQSMGTFTVYLFFALSALTMMMVYGRTFTAGVFADNLARFYRARTARILPLLALVSLASAALARTPEAAVKGLLTGTGALALGPPGFISIGNGAWSLGIELAFYAVFPVLALILGRASTMALVAATLAAVALQQAYLWLIAPTIADPRHWHLYIAPLTFAPLFLIGFVVHRAGDTRSRVWLFPTLALVAAVAGFSLLYPAQLFTDHAVFVALTVLVGCLLFAAWRTELPTVLVRPAEFLGEISYSLYLTHFFFFVAAQRLTERFDLPTWQFWALFMVSAIGGAGVCYRWFERPMRERFGKSDHASARSGSANTPLM